MLKVPWMRIYNMNKDLNGHIFVMEKAKSCFSVRRNDKNNWSGLIFASDNYVLPRGPCALISTVLIIVNCSSIT